MVDPYPSKSVSIRKIRNLVRRGLVLPWPYRLVRFALAALFICGGVSKLFDPMAFAATISAYGLVPGVLLPLIAVGLPVVETVGGLALLLDRRWGLPLITGLLTLFVFVLGYGILGDLDVDCGCFGAEELDKRASLRAAFYRDLVLIGVVLPYLFCSRRIREREAGRQRDREPTVSDGVGGFRGKPQDD